MISEETCPSEPLSKASSSVPISVCGRGKGGEGGEAGRGAPDTGVRIPSSAPQPRAPRPRAAPGTPCELHRFAFQPQRHTLCQLDQSPGKVRQRDRGREWNPGRRPARSGDGGGETHHLDYPGCQQFLRRPPRSSELRPRSAPAAWAADAPLGTFVAARRRPAEGPGSAQRARAGAGGRRCPWSRPSCRYSAEEPAGRGWRSPGPRGPRLPSTPGAPTGRKASPAPSPPAPRTR